LYWVASRVAPRGWEGQEYSEWGPRLPVTSRRDFGFSVSGIGLQVSGVSAFEYRVSGFGLKYRERGLEGGPREEGDALQVVVVPVHPLSKKSACPKKLESRAFLAQTSVAYTASLGGATHSRHSKKRFRVFGFGFRVSGVSGFGFQVSGFGLSTAKGASRAAHERRVMRCKSSLCPYIPCRS